MCLRGDTWETNHVIGLPYGHLNWSLWGILWGRGQPVNGWHFTCRLAWYVGPMWWNCRRLPRTVSVLCTPPNVPNHRLPSDPIENWAIRFIYGPGSLRFSDSVCVPVIECPRIECGKSQTINRYSESLMLFSSNIWVLLGSNRMKSQKYHFSSNFIIITCPKSVLQSQE